MIFYPTFLADEKGDWGGKGLSDGGDEDLYFDRGDGVDDDFVNAKIRGVGGRKRNSFLYFSNNIMQMI